MPPADTIRRCAFKVPKNDKYQCQKAGDKHQLHVDLWYCRFHDRHAKDRCQALIEWAGKGAQCEQLGVWGEQQEKKLCDWHNLKSRGDDWPLVEDGAVDTTIIVEVLDTKKDTLVQAGLVHSSWSTSTLSSGHQPEQDPKPDAQLDGEPHVEHVSMGVTPEEQPSYSAPVEALVDINPDPATIETEDNTTFPDKHDEIPTTKPSPSNNISDTSSTSTSAPPPSTAKTTPSTPTGPLSSTIHTAYAHVIHSLTLPNTPPPHRTLHVRSDSLDPLHAHEPATPTRTPALYVQCCVCLEKHSEEVMRRVEGCGHQYRELCLRKVVKSGGGNGSGRRYNCRGCGEWVEGVRRGYETSCA